MAVELTRKSFTPYAAKKGEEYMNARQRAHFRKILEALKAELSEEIDRTVHTMQDEATVFADPNERQPGVRHGARAAQPRPRKEADQEDRRDHRAHRRERVRLLRELRRRDRSQAARGAPHRDPVHRLQDARRAARAPGREVKKTTRSASRFPEG